MAAKYRIYFDSDDDPKAEIDRVLPGVKWQGPAGEYAIRRPQWAKLEIKDDHVSIETSDRHNPEHLVQEISGSLGWKMVCDDKDEDR